MLIADVYHFPTWASLAVIALDYDTAVFFAVSCVLVFSFGFVRDGRPVADVVAGILWITVAFAGTLALGRTFERERQNDTLRGAAAWRRADRPAIYRRQAVARDGAAVRVELVLVPLVALFFQVPLDRAAAGPDAGAAGGRAPLGYAAVGTLFAAMLVRTRTRDVLLPVAAVSDDVPVIIAGVRGTAALLAPSPTSPGAAPGSALLDILRRGVRHLALWTFGR